jgi:hypothetical protein
MTEKNNKGQPKKVKAYKLPGSEQVFKLYNADKIALENARAQAIDELSKKHDISKTVAACILDAKLKEMHIEADNKQAVANRVRNLLDDCYPDDE